MQPTGDLVTRLATGEFRHEGRTDHIINVAGTKVDFVGHIAEGVLDDPQLKLLNRHRVVVDVQHGQAMAAVQQLGGHGQAHRADAQISRFHVFSPVS